MRRFWLGTAVVGATALLVVCGSSGAKPFTLVSRSYAKTTAARTAKLAITVRTIETGSGSQLSSTVTSGGVVDFVSKSFDLTTNAPQGGTVETREIGNTLFEQVPASERSQVPGGDPWVSIDLNRLAEAKTGTNLAALRAAGNDDPSQPLGYLEAIASNVTKDGSATIGGVKTTGYTVQVDLDKIKAKQPSAVQRQNITTEEQLLGTDTLAVQVWLDSAGLVRRERFTEPVAAANAAVGHPAIGGSQETTLDYSDFGVAVSVAPPPSSETADITDEAIASSANATTTSTTSP